MSEHERWCMCRTCAARQLAKDFDLPPLVFDPQPYGASGWREATQAEIDAAGRV